MGGLGGPVGSNMFGEDSPHSYPPTSTHYGHYEPSSQEYPNTSQMQYKTDFKTEPVTPGLGHPGESAYPYPGVPFTPSPSSSGCESPGTPYPSSFKDNFIFFLNLCQKGLKNIWISLECCSR